MFDAHLGDPEFGNRLLAEDARAGREIKGDRAARRITSSNGRFSAFGKPRRSSPATSRSLAGRRRPF